jgi:hypothetical protein
LFDVTGKRIKPELLETHIMLKRAKVEIEVAVLTEIEVAVLTEILSSEDGNFTAVAYATATIQLSGATYGLSERMARHVRDFDAKTLKAFTGDFYTSVKDQATAAKMDTDKAYSRATSLIGEVKDKLDPTRVTARAENRAKRLADKIEAAGEGEGEAKITPQHVVDCLQFILNHPQQFTLFCSQADAPVFSRLLGVIANHMKLAKTGKR